MNNVAKQLDFTFTPTNLSGCVESLLNNNQKLVLFNRLGVYGDLKTLDSIGKIVGDITRERVRQIYAQGIKIIRKAYDDGDIIDENLSRIDFVSKKETPIDLIEYDKPPIYGRDIYLNLITSIFSDKYRISTHKSLTNPILVRVNSNFESRIDTLVSMLKSCTEFKEIDELKNEIGVSSDVIMKISGIVKKNGKVCLIGNTNVFYEKSIKGLIEKTLESVGRPSTISQIEDLSGLSFNQIRGALIRMSSVVNVGRSMYALKSWGYFNGTTADVIYHYLYESNNPMTYKNIERLVIKQRFVKKGTIQMALQTDSRFQLLESDYWVLAEWNFLGIKEKRKLIKYPISVRKALVETLGKSHGEMMTTRQISELLRNKYNNRTSSKIVTVTSVLNSLVQGRLVEKLYVGKNVFYKFIGADK